MQNFKVVQNDDIYYLVMEDGRYLIIDHILGWTPGWADVENDVVLFESQLHLKDFTDSNYYAVEAAEDFLCADGTYVIEDELIKTDDGKNWYLYQGGRELDDSAGDMKVNPVASYSKKPGEDENQSVYFKDIPHTCHKVVATHNVKNPQWEVYAGDVFHKVYDEATQDFNWRHEWSGDDVDVNPPYGTGPLDMMRVKSRG